MRIISNKILVEFYSLYKDSESCLKSWYQEAKKSDWSKPQDIKDLFRNASFVGDNRVVFNICGNKYRLVVFINYDYKIIYIKFVGTHEQYNKIDVQNIGS